MHGSMNIKFSMEHLYPTYNNFIAGKAHVILRVFA